MERLQFARIGIEKVVVHSTPCIVKRTNDTRSGLLHCNQDIKIRLMHDEYPKLLRQSEACYRQRDGSELSSYHHDLQIRKIRMHLNNYVGYLFFRRVHNLKFLLTTSQRVAGPKNTFFKSGSQIANINDMNSNQIRQNRCFELIPLLLFRANQGAKSFGIVRLAITSNKSRRRRHHMMDKQRFE